MPSRSRLSLVPTLLLVSLAAGFDAAAADGPPKREKKIYALRLDSPEPITDRPFRETNAMTCFSTEFVRHWRADFGDAPPLLCGEFADDDQDGLPNWFEMYWFGKFLDWNTAIVADPKALGKDGKTNLQHYLDQTAPVDIPATGPSGRR